MVVPVAAARGVAVGARAVGKNAANKSSAGGVRGAEVVGKRRLSPHAPMSADTPEANVRNAVVRRSVQRDFMDTKSVAARSLGRRVGKKMNDGDYLSSYLKYVDTIEDKKVIKMKERLLRHGIVVSILNEEVMEELRRVVHDTSRSKAARAAHLLVSIARILLHMYLKPWFLLAAGFMWLMFFPFSVFAAALFLGGETKITLDLYFFSIDTGYAVKDFLPTEGFGYGIHWSIAIISSIVFVVYGIIYYFALGINVISYRQPLQLFATAVCWVGSIAPVVNIFPFLVAWILLISYAGVMLRGVKL